MVGLAVLWVYLRRHDAFVGFSNSILLANLIGLLGYVFVPTGSSSAKCAVAKRLTC